MDNEIASIVAKREVVEAKGGCKDVNLVVVILNVIEAEPNS
jgi:hypothetical protein